MFTIVSLLSFYMGTNNIFSAFKVNISNWEFINYSLFISGFVLILVGIACMLQSIKDLRQAKKLKAEKELLEKEKRQKLFFEDFRE